MRNAILAVTVLALCGTALVNPFIGMLGYLWYGLMRPDVLAWTYGMYPYSFALAVATLVGSIAYLRSFVRVLQDHTCVVTLVLIALYILSTFTAVDRGASVPFLIIFLKSIPILLLIPILTTTEQQLRQLFLVISASPGVIGLKFGQFIARAGGSHLTVNYGGFLSDSNGLALAMAMTVPLVWYSLPLVQKRYQRLGMLLLAIGCLITVMGSGSRGSSIGLAVVILVIILRSRHKVSLTVGIALLLVPILLWVATAYVDRMSTIQDYEADPSASHRLEYWAAALKLAVDYPAMGVGFGSYNWIEIGPRYLGYRSGQVVHNTYLQVLVDSGVLTLLVYVYLLFGTMVRLGVSARQMAKIRPDLMHYPYALQGSLIAWSIGSIFYSRVGFDLFFIVVMASSAWFFFQRQLMEQLAAEEAQPARAASQPDRTPAWTPELAGVARTQPAPRSEPHGRNSLLQRMTRTR